MNTYDEIVAKPEPVKPASKSEEGCAPQRKESDGNKMFKDNILKNSLNLLNAVINAIEETVWEAREKFDDTVDKVQAFERDRAEVWQETQEVGKKISGLPAQASRLVKTGVNLTMITASYRLWGTRSAFIGKEKRQKALDKTHEKNAQRFRDLSLAHGGAFLKVGQVLSTRADILPSAWVENLKVLQDQANPVDFVEIETVIVESLGKSPSEIFKSFDEEPIAAASIGQVHKAVLLSGEEVAVKIQRPGIAGTIKQDMVLMKAFISSLDSMLPDTDFNSITKEIERSVIKELDYKQEAKWMERVGEFLSEKTQVNVPTVYKDLSTEKVLVSSFVKAKKLTDVLDELKASGDVEKLSDVIGSLLDAYLHQVLDAGVFQADPHAGNILVDEHGQITLLDFGCTMVLSHQFKVGYQKVLMFALQGNTEQMAKILDELGFKTRSGNPETLLAFAESLIETFKIAIEGMGKNGGAMVWPEGDEVFEQAEALLQKAEDDPVEKLPSEFIMLARVFASLGGLFGHYQPELDAAKYILPHVARLHNIHG